MREAVVVQSVGFSVRLTRVSADPAHQFDVETAVESTAPDRWSAHVSDQWNIGENPNGGYLTSIGLRAARTLGPHPDPLTVTTHFLRPGSGAADAEVTTSLIRTGRTLTTSRVALSQGGKQRIEVLGAFGTLGPADAEPVLDIAMPTDFPDPDECLVRSGLEQGVSLPIRNRLDTRIHPAQAAAGKAERAEVSGWIRFTDGRPTDAASLVLFADAFPPSVFGLLGYIGWVPTIELTVHVRAQPAPGWIAGRFQSHDLRDGRLIEDGVLWDERGTLVAQSRQIGLLLTDA